MATPEQQTLLAAADLIERDGWWNGEGRRISLCAPYCASTAIARAAKAERTELYYAVRDRFQRHIGTRRITHWNDAQPSGEVVIKALRDCAASLEG